VGAGVAAVLGLSGIIAAVRRRDRSGAGETVDWIDRFSMEIETRLLEAAETVEQEIDSSAELAQGDRAKVDVALERGRERISEACANLLYKLGGPPNSGSAEGEV
jgi:hypothetical protein